MHPRKEIGTTVGKSSRHLSQDRLARRRNRVARVGKGTCRMSEDEELWELRAFMAAAARLFTSGTIAEKLRAAAAALVEGGLFADAAARVYRQRFSARCLVAGVGLGEGELDALRGDPDPVGSVERALASARVVAPSCYRVGAGPQDARGDAEWGDADRLIALLRVGDTVVGDIQARRPNPRRLHAESLTWLGRFVSLVDQVLEQDLRSRLDRLTRAFNAGYLDLVLARLGRTGTVFTAVYADMDGLKAVNDRYGHLVGDRFIQAAHDILLRVLPEDGLLYRPYGDEFVYLREADDPAPVARAAQRVPHLVRAWNERARRDGWGVLGDLEAISTDLRGPVPALQLSVGWAHGKDADASAVVRAAEQRMYAQKAEHHGRSRAQEGEKTTGPR